MSCLIKAKEIFLENKIVKDSAIVINQNNIEKIISSNESEKFGDIDSVLDYSKYNIIPGLIDTHIHGAVGADTMDAEFDSLNKISKYLCKNGITSFMPTTVTDDFEKTKNALKNVKCSMGRVQGAEILGSYVEGPYITKEHRGAHPENFIRDIKIAELEELIKASANTIKVIALAPEKEHSKEFIQYLNSKNIFVSIGHTNATFNEANSAYEEGARICIHTYNGMRGLHHREPGALGAVLINDNVYSELICDLIHVRKEAIEILLRCKPKDKIVLISDSIQAAGLKDGNYVLGAAKVIVKDSIARTESGSLAGSTIHILKAVKNMINACKVNPVDAVNMASLNPAREIKMDQLIGSIEENKKANLVAVDDDYNVKATIVNGKVVYNNDEL